MWPETGLLGLKRTERNRVMAVSEPNIKVQTWGDDLRLPCFLSPTGLLTDLEPLRRPSLPFQSKHIPALKRNTWFVMKRSTVRSGLVVVWPAMKCCVYISGDAPTQKRPEPRVALLRIRIDPQFLSDDVGLTVFSATLSSATRRLVLDDTLLWKGRRIFETETFSKRWNRAVQWVEHYCLLDPRLMGGLEIEMARWEPLDSLRPEKSWELQPDEVGRKRLLWIANYSSQESETEKVPQTVASFAPSAPVLETGPLVAKATRDSGPEQWLLEAGDGKSLGKALIRTLAVSSVLRSAKTDGLRVEVSWNRGFQKWEILGLSDSLVTVAGAKFDASK